MNEPKSGRDFFGEYLERQEKDFEKWCNDNNRNYVDVLTDKERHDALFNEYWNALKAKNEAEKAQEEAENEKKKAYERQMDIERFEKSIPTRYINANISDFRMKGDASAILEGASGLILGNNGPGKTRFKWAVSREWVNAGDRVEIVKAQKLLFDIKTADNPYEYIERNYGRRVKRLVIDEIDKIFESKADFVYLFYLVDYRYEWMLQTLVVGNGDQDSFMEALGQSIFSRLTGDGGVFIQFDGKDRRMS